MIFKDASLGGPRGKDPDLPQPFEDSKQNTEEGIPFRCLETGQSGAFSSEVGVSQSLVQEKQYQHHRGTCEK